MAIYYQDWLLYFIKKEQGMKKQEVSKPQIIEFVSIMSKRRRSLRSFEDDCEFYSWNKSDVEELIKNVPLEYQERYNVILSKARADIESLSSEVLEHFFSSSSPE